MAGERYLAHIWDEVAQAKGHVEELVTLNQELLQGIPIYRRVFGGRYHFSTFLHFLSLMMNVSLLNPSLDPDYSGGGGLCPGSRARRRLRHLLTWVWTPTSWCSIWTDTWPWRDHCGRPHRFAWNQSYLRIKR